MASITSDGVTIAYDDIAPQVSQGTVVLIHGFASNRNEGWKRTGWYTAFERRGFRVIALDQRGHGESEHASEYNMDALVADVAGWADAVGLSRFDVVGHSMGGVVGFCFAAKYPQRVGRLVIVDIGPDAYTSEGIGNVRQGIAGAITARFPSVEAAIAYNSTLENNRYVSPAILARRTRAALVQKEDGWAPRFDAAGISRPDGLLPNEEEMWEAVNAVQCPSLLVRGVESPILNDSTAQRMVQEMKDCRLVTIERAAHGVPTDNPDAFLDAVRSFLA